MKVFLEEFGGLLPCQNRVEDVLTFEITEVADIVDAAEEFANLLSQKLHDLAAAPDEKLSLCAFTVRVLGGIKASFRMEHLAQKVLQGLFDHAFE